MENNLTKIVVKINDDNISLCENILKASLVKYSKIFSYLIYYTGDNSFRIEVNISDKDYYNAFTRDEIIPLIVNDIKTKEPNKSNIVSFIQPNAEICIETYEPLIKKLSRQQSECWSNFEYEDLCQICRMCIVVLKNKGYYINPKLITRAFINEILMQLRKNPANVVCCSIYDNVQDTEDIQIADMIADESLENKQYDEEIHDANLSIMNELRDIIIDYIGPRGYEQLLKEYGSQQTSCWGRKTLQQLKRHLDANGYTYNKYKKYY